MYARRLIPSVLAFSLSLYRHPFIHILFSSLFTSYNKNQKHPQSNFLTDGEEVTAADIVVVNEEEEDDDPLRQHPRKKTVVGWSNHRECILLSDSPGTVETRRVKFRPVVSQVIPFGGVGTTM